MKRRHLLALPAGFAGAFVVPTRHSFAAAPPSLLAQTDEVIE